MKPKNLGRLLDHVRAKRPLTTFEVSRICGVVHGTVSKWINDGKLAAFKTPGGHRRVRVSDLLVFLKIYNILVASEVEKALEEGPEESSLPKGAKILVLEEDPAMSEMVVKFIKDNYPAAQVAPVRMSKPLDLPKIKEALRKLLIFLVLVSVTPRKIFTPNGDGVNDTISVRVQNPGAEARGRIFDLKGNVISEMRTASADTFVWDGRESDGNAAPKGIYIYQIESGRDTLRGTIVLAR